MLKKSPLDCHQREAILENNSSRDLRKKNMSDKSLTKKIIDLISLKVTKTNKVGGSRP